MDKLPPDIIDNHILPLLDGTTLTALSSVSSEFRRMIINKEELWKNICASTWPYLLLMMDHAVSTFPGGYRSFFSNAFPSLHCSNNNNSSSFHSIDLPPINFLYFIDMYLEEEGERESYHCCPTAGITVGKRIKSEGYCDFQWLSELSVPEKNGAWMDYFHNNLRLTWILIDGTGKCARSLFGPRSKPVSIKSTWRSIELVYAKVMPGQCEDYTEMVKCHMKVTCSLSSNGLKETRLEAGMKDMNGKRVWQRHANIIIHNAIQNGERKKF